MTRAIHQFMPVILVLNDIFFSFKQRMVDKLRRVMNVPNVRGKKEKRKEKGKQCPMPSNQEKGGQSRGMHETYSYETHLRNSK